MKIKLLDLCCKAGGCSVGYARAAKALNLDIEIVGVDIAPQPNYPFKFIQADAENYLKKHNQYFTHFHASPPCQKYSNSTATARKNGKVYKDNLEPLTKLFYAINKPGVIENVMASPVRRDIILRGDMFNLKVIRKRKFELVNWFMLRPGLATLVGQVKKGDFAQVVGNGQKGVTGGVKFKSEYNTILEQWSEAMQIDWMTTDELREAIPPAYTEYIGMDFLLR
jgi:DNA (cytosine-5)-methyltransferase 1